MRFHPEIMVSANKKKKNADKWDPRFGLRPWHKIVQFFQKKMRFQPEKTVSANKTKKMRTNGDCSLN